RKDATDGSIRPRSSSRRRGPTRRRTSSQPPTSKSAAPPTRTRYSNPATSNARQPSFTLSLLEGQFDPPVVQQTLIEHAQARRAGKDNVFRLPAIKRFLVGRVRQAHSPNR